MPASQPYSVVIPTSGRSKLLKGVFESLSGQRHAPSEVIVVDAGLGKFASEACQSERAGLPIQCVPAEVASAAKQRNQGAALASTPVTVFCDDDMSFGPDLMEKLCHAVSDPSLEVAGVAARINGLGHHAPGSLLRTYYRFQAGYAHPHYGCRVIGPAINFLPCYEAEAGPIAYSDWLNSGLVAYRSDVFREEQFPDFSGYSYMEDVHLSYRVSRRFKTAFHCDAICEHHGVESTASLITRAELVEMQWKNRVRIVRELMKTPRRKALMQLRFHRQFILFFLRKSRQPGWREEYAGLKAMNLVEMYDQAPDGTASRSGA